MSKSDDPQLNRLQDRLEALHDASWEIFEAGDPAKRAAYLQRLSEVAEAWRALADAVDETRRPRLADVTASLLARIGDDLFYGRGAADEAIAAFEQALAIAPDHRESLSGIVAAHLQGRDRPDRALPYAERRAAIDPTRQGDVTYIRSLIASRGPAAQ